MMGMPPLSSIVVRDEFQSFRRACTPAELGLLATLAGVSSWTITSLGLTSSLRAVVDARTEADR
jgi:hypothetical protein